MYSLVTPAVSPLSSHRLSFAQTVPAVASAWLMALFLLVAATFVTPGAGAQTPTPLSVPAWRYGDGAAGANTHETTLTPANVNASTFGKLFSVAVDGYVYGQPLYMAGIKMVDGQLHNVVFVATEHDSVYAFDADSNGGANALPIWQASMITTAHGAAAGATTVPKGDVASNDIINEVGITSTPVIDPVAQTLFVVAKSKENGGYVQRLHALNMITGTEQPGSPVVITATVTGKGNGSSGGKLALSPLWQNQRTALSFFNGHVYVAFGAHSDNGPYHGWVLAYDGTTLAQTAAICLSPSGTGSGIWMGGAALPIDPAGNGSMFLVTGNGDLTNYPAITAANDFGDSIVKLDLTNGGLQVVDAFTPSNQAALSGQDRDQGSGGVLLLPDQQGSNPHLAVQAGKSGALFLLNRDNLGGYNPSSTYNSNAVQEVYDATTGLWSTPAFWNGNVYMWGSNDYLRVYSLNSGLLSGKQTGLGSVHSGFPGASPSISADGTQNGIVWAVNSQLYTSNGPEVLYAYDASNISNILYTSATNARDNAGPANKFSIPVVANGKVYVGASYLVNVYGLLNGDPVAAAPTISPAGGTFGNAQVVTLASSTASAAIYYTTDGSTPTTASPEYTSPITLSANTTIRAVASATGYVQSSVSTASFTFNAQTPAPSVTPNAGTYSGAQSVSMSDTDATAVIYYTLDGSTPSASSATYKAPLSVGASTTVKAIAIDPALAGSGVTTAVYQVQAPGGSINYPYGFANTTGLTLNGSAVATDDSRLQLTTDINSQAGSFFANTPVNIQSFTTAFAFQLSSAVADGFTFTIQNTGVHALGGASAALGYGAGNGRAGIAKSVAVKFDIHNNAGEGSDSTGLYTNGATPTVPSINIATSGIQLNSGDTIEANVVYDGATLTLTLTDGVTNKTFTTQFAVNIPQIVGGPTAYVGFTGGTGGSSASQKIGAWTFSSGASSQYATNYASGFANANGLALNGTATVVSSSQALQLTNSSQHGAAASAWFTTPVNASNFSTDFTFQLQQAVADGFTFTLQGVGTKALGAPSGNLGYGASTAGGTNGIAKSVAIKFDIHNNAGEGNNSTGLYTNGVQPNVPSVNLTGTGITLASGDPIHAQLVYDGTTLHLTLTDTVTQGMYTTAFTINIPAIVGASTAYAGFTGGTGGSAVTTLITAWTYSN